MLTSLDSKLMYFLMVEQQKQMHDTLGYNHWEPKCLVHHTSFPHSSLKLIMKTE